MPRKSMCIHTMNNTTIRKWYKRFTHLSSMAWHGLTVRAEKQMSPFFVQHVSKE